ncbi:metallophosphoesterase family protein [Leptospira interrogans]|uniref:Ser/Thr phosphatase family protein n=2 Tax=Leptospira interrogans TaxID=173 RepID=A0A0F6H4J5_LEPIR|nr:metallophosphoesterase [Leptospira interrogans]EKO23129.1 Ser/Thr phosphatase family protein [Leptospira interrogans str. UI 12621]
MNIGILHLTDIHFSPETDVSNKINGIANILTSNLQTCKIIFLIISGDIANKGTAQEYEVAKTFIEKLSMAIKHAKKNVEIRYIFVPGNHDCNLEKDSQVRRNLIRDINYRSLGTDNTVIDFSLIVQEDFWNFYSGYRAIPENKLYFKIQEKIESYTICFHCLNTAWMSKLKEEPGTLFFPVDKFNVENSANSLDIGVYHHPVNWFNPTTEKNNKREIQAFLDSVSGIQFSGHEHAMSLDNREDFDNSTSSIYVSGQNFNLKDNPGSCGFNILEINLKNQEATLNRYLWKADIFISENSKTFNYSIKKIRDIQLNEDYKRIIEDIKIPLSLNGNKLNLSDIYIFPDLERTGIENNSLDEYIDSLKFLDEEEFSISILEGESQVGKTSLLYMQFLKLHDRGYYPLYIDGSKITNLKPERITKTSFEKVYSSASIEYDKYLQLPRSKKVIFIDNLHRIKFDHESKRNLLAALSECFSKVIVTVDAANSILPLLHSEFSSFSCFKIKAFGFRKTNDLIERYFRLKENLSSVEEHELLSKIKHTFDQIRALLGNQILPSYPVFLLSIIQSLEKNSFDLKETSFAHCYQALITMALVNKSKVNNEDFSIYMNYLKELSFKIFNSEGFKINEIEYLQFQVEYSKTWLLPNAKKITEKLLESQILKYENSSYEFSYKYIFYYLVAQYIANIINKDEGKAIVQKLFEALHLEVNANILVFITHHTQDVAFIQESLLSAMIHFDKISPITLTKECHLYKQINELASAITNDIIEENRNKPLLEREKALVSQDKEKRELEKTQRNEELSSEEINEFVYPFVQAYRSIDIVGQIVKNRRGSLPKSEIVEIISELYLTGFRMVSSFGEIISNERESLTEEIKEKIQNDYKTKYKDHQWMLEKGLNDEEINKKIKIVFNLMTLGSCLSVFSKLIHSAGIKDFKEIYDDVAKRIGSPAAKLVSFSINSYFNKVSSKDVQELANQFKGNFVANFILKARVKSYIYFNYVDKKEIQRIAQILDMRISPAKKSN